MHGVQQTRTYLLKLSNNHHHQIIIIEPVRPTMPIFSPGWMEKESPLRTKGPSLYLISYIQKEYMYVCMYVYQYYCHFKQTCLWRYHILCNDVSTTGPALWNLSSVTLPICIFDCRFLLRDVVCVVGDSLHAIHARIQHTHYVNLVIMRTTAIHTYSSSTTKIFVCKLTVQSYNESLPAIWRLGWVERSTSELTQEIAKAIPREKWQRSLRYKTKPNSSYDS